MLYLGKRILVFQICSTKLSCSVYSYEGAGASGDLDAGVVEGDAAGAIDLAPLRSQLPPAYARRQRQDLRAHPCRVDPRPSLHRGPHPWPHRLLYAFVII